MRTVSDWSRMENPMDENKPLQCNLYDIWYFHRNYLNTIYFQTNLIWHERWVKKKAFVSCLNKIFEKKKENSGVQSFAVYIKSNMLRIFGPIFIDSLFIFRNYYTFLFFFLSSKVYLIMPLQTIFVQSNEGIHDGKGFILIGFFFFIYNIGQYKLHIPFEKKGNQGLFVFKI